MIVSAIVDSSGKPEKILAASPDITDYKRADRSLRAIAEGTAEATDDEFFRSLARCAAQALGAQYAFVAETLSEDPIPAAPIRAQCSSTSPIAC